MKLEAIRLKIDQIDGAILTLVQKRFILSQEIARVKKTQGLAIEDQKREKKLMEKLLKKGTSMNISKELVEKLFTVILYFSKKEQEKDFL
ncbi:chorismate mutase [Candidatus Gottesmanbacteria bacterium]|nr:chorismate mutase [Candidatus Gottesmanbacteria bacterium]